MNLPVLRLVVAAALLSTCHAQAFYNPDFPDRYALNLTLEIPEHAALAEVTLPLAVYEAIRRPGLADLRVFNAKGERQPIAVLPPQQTEAHYETQITLLPLPKRTPNGRDEIELSLQKDENGQLRRLDLNNRPIEGNASSPPPDRWLADLGTFRHPVTGIDVQWATGESFEGHLSIDGSEDLQNWTPLISNVALISVSTSQGQVERSHIELPRPTVPARTHYLRLHWQGDHPPPLKALKLTSLISAPPPPTQWYPVRSNSTDSDGSFLYTAQALLPVHGADLRLPPGNIISNVAIDTRYYPDKPWINVARGSAYNLGNGPLGAQTSKPFLFKEYANPLWRLKFDPDTAPHEAPQLLLGWTPHRIVFPVRGPGPFILAAGKPGERAFQYPAPQIIPGYGTPEAAPVAVARVEPAHIKSGQHLGGGMTPAARETPSWAQPRNQTLWGALIAGVLLLGFMAHSLLNRSNRPTENNGKDPE